MLNWLGIKDFKASIIDITQHREIQLERLAKVCNEHLNMAEIKRIIAQGKTT